MALLDELRARKAEIEALGAQYGISNIRVFGSVVRGEETPDSDIDLLVHIDVSYGGFAFLDFKEDVENLIHRECDVVSDRGLYHLVKPLILLEARPL